jgi:hypothetical protein
MGWKRVVITFALAASAGVWGPSCGSDKLFDCQSVCSRFQSCFDSTYDVAACRMRCTDNAGREVEYRRRVDDCEACIDDRSCASLTFSCAARCLGIVP